MGKTWNTRYSLIDRIKESNDHQAWDDFVHHYRPFIYFMLNQMEINYSERDDLVQEILLKLHGNMVQYAKQQARFRSWLGTVIRNTAIKYLAKMKTRDKHSTEIRNSLKALESYSSSDFEMTIQQEWEQYLVEQAMERLRSVFDENVMGCFEMTLDNVPVEEIAERLQVKVKTVYMIRTRMKTRMMLEMQQLMKELEF